MNKLTNNCKLAETLALYNRFNGNHHVHTIMMLVDDDLFTKGAEVVLIGFELHGINYTAHINASNGNTILTNENFEHYGETTADQLITFLDSQPHINSILM